MTLANNHLLLLAPLVSRAKETGGKKKAKETMTLKFKRNYPLVLMLLSILSMLALTLGNRPIVSYTVDTQALQMTGPGVFSDGLADFISLFNIPNAASTLGETLNSVQP